jgi:hypothetical protein
MADSRQPTPTRKTALAPDVRRLDERAARAWTERMAVRPLGDGRYAVDSQSGATYVVDPDAHSCTCPDHEIRGAVCKHMRRVAIEISTRRVPPPGKRFATCAACGAETTVDRDSAPPALCLACALDSGDVVRDRESGDRLVVVGVLDARADEIRVGPDERPVADYETNAAYPRDDIVVEAVYLGDYGDEDARTYSFPRSRLDRVDDAALVV